MQAYKVKGKVDATGNLVVAEPIDIPPGNVEVIILQVADEVKSPTETPNIPQLETKRPKKSKLCKAGLKRQNPLPLILTQMRQDGKL
ncbi:MAG: hypothetical protein QNJ63_31150 [Calothrix sp. MO_192.B10]|nr:hypothetical protein [Calothrix sp. MO_192.B10]